MAQPSGGLTVVTPQAESCSRWTDTGWVIRELSLVCFDRMTRIFMAFGSEGYVLEVKPARGRMADAPLPQAKEP
jgi:hypothetical protein